MSEALFKFKHATIGWPQRPVLSGVDLEIPAGAFVGILGANGSGKTTSLKTVLGLIPLLKGQLIRRGAGLGEPRFGYVPQRETLDTLFPITAYDVAAMGTYRRVELFRRLRGLDERPLVEKCLAACGASAFAKKRYSDLSGGQRQRVLLSRALAAEPDVLALDEPLAGIDVTTQKSLIKLLKELKDERRLTVLMVSHRVRAERGLFTHILWCDEGKAIFGTAEELLGSGKVHETFESEL